MPTPVPDTTTQKMVEETFRGDNSNKVFIKKKLQTLSVMENSSPDPSPRDIRFHEATLITLRAIFKK